MSALPEVVVARPDVNEGEGVAKASRRRFAAEYKRRILWRAAPGAIGGLLRREGLYSSHLTTWRAQREGGLGPGRISSKPSCVTSPRGWSSGSYGKFCSTGLPIGVVRRDDVG